MLFTTIHSVMELERLRGEIAELLEGAGVGVTLVADIGLVVTELAVNGFEHAAAVELEIKVLLERHEITVELTHVGVVELNIPASSSMPDPQSLRHRGLAIIDSLSSRRQTVAGPSGTIVRCSIAR